MWIFITCGEFPPRFIRGIHNSPLWSEIPSDRDARSVVYTRITPSLMRQGGEELTIHRAYSSLGQAPSVRRTVINKRQKSQAAGRRSSEARSQAPSECWCGLLEQQQPSPMSC